MLLVFGVLWWMYGGYAWLTNTRTPDRAPERLLLLLGMAGFLVVGLAIPHGFGPDGASSGVVPRPRLPGRGAACTRRCTTGSTGTSCGSRPFNLASALLVIVAGLTDRRPPPTPLWAAALAIQVLSPLFVRPRRPVRDRSRRTSSSGTAR